MQTRIASRLDIRMGAAREALELYGNWLGRGDRDTAPVVMGKLASSLELIVEALEDAGETPA